ncbi:MAG: phytoene desaturase family protein [Candidatus Helarchaeota archaeon]
MVRPDVIIVGAGEGGLFTAAILAKNGFNSLVFEQKPVIGGRAMSFEYQPHYILDWGIHSVRYGKKGIIPSIFRKDLGIKLKLLDYGEGKLFQRGEWIPIPTSLNAFMETPLLTQQQREEFIPLFMEIIRLKVEDYLNVSVKEYFQDKISGGDLWRLIKLLAAGLMVTPNIERASMGEMIDGLKQVIAAGKGAMYPKGGWKTIFDHLIEIICQEGEIRTNTPVSKVLIEGQQVKGVRLADGTKIEGDRVVMAIPAQIIFALLPKTKFPSEFQNLCTNLISSSGISIEVGLRTKVSEEKGLLAVENPLTLACFQSNVDPSIAPADEQLFTMLQLHPQETVKSSYFSKQAIQGMLKLMEQMFPNIRPNIKWRRILKLPIIDGAINYIGQTRDKRPPVKSNVISGLYFAGDTYNGAGLGGDIAPSSARLCASYILEES